MVGLCKIIIVERRLRHSKKMSNKSNVTLGCQGLYSVLDNAAPPRQITFVGARNARKCTPVVHMQNSHTFLQENQKCKTSNKPHNIKIGL